MDSKFSSNSSNPYINEQEDIDASQENIAESPPSSTVFSIDGLVPSPTSSSKRRSVYILSTLLLWYIIAYISNYILLEIEALQGHS